MNIFVLDEDPCIAARQLCDKHIPKMVLETAQLLCSAHETAPYKRTHYNHPCAIWTRASLSNYKWLLWHGVCMAKEYERRFLRKHKSEEVIDWAEKNEPSIFDYGLTPFAQAMPVQYKNEDPVLAYRTYYVAEKSRFAKWKHSEVPDWYKEMMNASVVGQTNQTGTGASV